MQTLGERQLALDEIESDADFIVFSRERGLLSEHCTICEARVAFFTEARSFSLGDHLPTIYQRGDDNWVPLS
jgi:hypothetical protein